MASLQLLLSKLRLFHSIVSHLSPLPPLAPLLSTLKANMATGLPGQRGRPSSTMSAIQPPLPVPSPPSQPSAKARPIHSVAGPQERKCQGKGRGAKNRRKQARKRTDSGSDDSSRQSSDSESSSGGSSASELSSSLLRWGREGAESAAARGRGGRRWGRRGGGSGGAQQRGVGSGSSEGEVSADNSDAGSVKLKGVQSKIRHQALSSLALLFQLLDRHTAFSYWLSFLPDGPRPPNSPPLLLTCLLKDHAPKVNEWRKKLITHGVVPTVIPLCLSVQRGGCLCPVRHAGRLQVVSGRC